MSTNSNCDFIEVAKSKWFYVLEDYNAPKNAWDWREYATAYGPFADYDSAQAHLRENHPNPGGHTLSELPEGIETLDLSSDETLAKVIGSAKAPTSAGLQRWY